MQACEYDEKEGAVYALLTRPIVTWAGDLAMLKLRTPTAEELAELGSELDDYLRVEFRGKPAIEIVLNVQRAADWIALLSDLPRPIVDMMTMRDFRGLQRCLRWLLAKAGAKAAARIAN